MSKLSWEIEDRNHGNFTLTYPEPDECECKKCGENVTPSINPPSPNNGRYNGYADCPHCGDILYSIPGDEFDEVE